MVAPSDRTTIAFPAAQAMVNAIWVDLGLRYPPAVEMLPSQASATIARATRLSLHLAEQTPSWCLLHEIAHALTSTEDGRSDGHGPTFMGVYVQLLVQYLRCNESDLLTSLAAARIAVVPDARPSFLDPA